MIGTNEAFFLLMVLINIACFVIAGYKYIVAYKSIIGFSSSTEHDTKFVRRFLKNNNDGLSRDQILIKREALHWTILLAVIFTFTFLTGSILLGSST